MNQNYECNVLKDLDTMNDDELFDLLDLEL